eukprot:scaffold6307_cov111-Isochrysis_galbana.AAC.1
MAPLQQLRLEPTEVVSATDKGAARARVDSTDESSPQADNCHRLPCSGCRRTSVLIINFDNNGSTTTCPTSSSTASRSPFFRKEILTFVGTHVHRALLEPNLICARRRAVRCYAKKRKIYAEELCGSVDRSDGPDWIFRAAPPYLSPRL